MARGEKTKELWKNPEYRNRMRSSLTGRSIPEGVRRKISISLRGIKRGPFTEEHKKNLSLANIGKTAWSKGLKLPQKEGDKNPTWKGEKAGYTAKHDWIKSHYGKAIKCENPDCVYPRYSARGVWMEKPTNFDWANISDEYKRDRNDFKQLCRSCHIKWDREKQRAKGISHKQNRIDNVLKRKLGIPIPKYNFYGDNQIRKQII